ncbi:MAG: hypothetical protein HDT32_01670 [Clostridiales bacterium]|nr:hypothetical protein [Clostridiales bacterium]
MTKKKMRYITVALLALMITLTMYFCCIATCDVAQTAKADIDMILGDVDYNVMNVGKNNQTYMSFFNGYIGSPTVGSYFAYGIEPFTGKKLPTSYTGLENVKNNMYKTNVPFLSADEEYYIFMISFDFLGNGYVSSNNNYTELGYFHLKGPYSFLWGISIEKDKSGNIYLSESVSSRRTLIDNFSGGEGEFINVTVAFPSSYFGDGYFHFISDMPFAYNFYASFETDNLKLKNQSFMDMYVFQSLSHNLYLIDNMFEGYDQLFSEALQNAIKDNYDKGYSVGYNEGYANASTETDNISSFTWLKSLFSSVTSLFNIKLFGGVTLATVVSIPLILGIILFILKLVRG